MSPAHQDGLLDLRFGRDPEGRTRLQTRRHRFPLRTTVPFYLDPADPGIAFVYVQNPTGGVFGGDRLVTKVVAVPGARVHLTTQSATKLYRMEADEARHELWFDLGEDSYLEYLPDPVIPQAGTRFVQRTTVELGRRATFLATETIGPGRLPRGERFAYDRVAFRTEVRRDGEPLCVDASVLEPSRRHPERPGLLGGWDYLVTLLVVSPERYGNELARRLDAELAGDETSDQEVLGAAGSLPGDVGAFVRILARRALPARRALTRAVSMAREELLGHPLPVLRK